MERQAAELQRLAAAAMWQIRAVHLEAQLQALAAGPTREPATAPAPEPDQDTAPEAVAAPPRDDTPKGGTGRWWRTWLDSW